MSSVASIISRRSRLRRSLHRSPRRTGVSVWRRLRGKARQFQSRSVRTLDYAIDLALDASFGIRTFVRVPSVDPDPSARNGRYEPLPYRALYAIRARLPLSHADTLIDLGCGKGRVLVFLGAKAGRSIGVEICSALAEDARRNARTSRRRDARIDVRHLDAADADIGPATVVFMFNPFSAEVMRSVLSGIEGSLRRSPRALTICYANPREGALLDACSWLVPVDQFLVTQNGWRACPVRIWRAHRPPSKRA